MTLQEKITLQEIAEAEAARNGSVVEHRDHRVWVSNDAARWLGEDLARFARGLCSPSRLRRLYLKPGLSSRPHRRGHLTVAANVDRAELVQFTLTTDEAGDFVQTVLVNHGVRGVGGAIRP